VQSQILDLEASLRDVGEAVSRQRARFRLLRAQNATMFTRLKMATFALSNTLSCNETLPNPAVTTTASMAMQICTGSPTHTDSGIPIPAPHSHAAATTLLTRSRWAHHNSGGASPASTDLPRPLHHYLHTASISSSDILPHMPLSPPQHSSTNPSNGPQYNPTLGVSTTASSSLSANFSSCGTTGTCPLSYADAAAAGEPCSENTLLKAAVDNFVDNSTASRFYRPSEICWYIQFPFELEPGLRLSHSATLASTACHLSTSLIFWVTTIECGFLSHIEDQREKHVQGLTCMNSTHCSVDISSRSSPTSSLSEQTLPVRGSHSHGVAGSDLPELCPATLADRLRLRALHAENCELTSPLQVPAVPEHPPPLAGVSLWEADQHQSLLRLSLSCGEGQRYPVGAAVTKTVESVITRYREKMPYALWRRVCMQALHGLCGQLMCIREQDRDGVMHSHKSCHSAANPSSRCDTGNDTRTQKEGEGQTNSQQGHVRETGIDPQEQPLEMRPCTPGMCGATGMHGDTQDWRRDEEAEGVAGGVGAQQECTWEQLPSTVTAMLRLIHSLLREQVLQWDASSAGELFASSRRRNDNCSASKVGF
jgi:hypothetical protein